MVRLVEVKSARTGRLACAAMAVCLLGPGLVGGCASQELRPEEVEISKHPLGGRWRTAEGKTWEIRQRAVDSYSVRSVLPSTRQQFTATVRWFGGARFLEVSIFAPGNRAGVPVFLYGTVEVVGDTMTFRRVRADWLEREVRGDGRLTFVSTGDIERGTGGLVVRSQLALAELMARAAGNEEALAPAEVGMRVD